ncbi:hypothetical protein [Sphingobium sp. CECT 9361]|nr:hypothetical protein [Sphingobium sp. CECT 9361]CAH0355344.1 hypothetical protein SPH9361_03421 [Sphingobium sp. CECT 9361]
MTAILSLAIPALIGIALIARAVRRNDVDTAITTVSAMIVFFGIVLP